MAPEGPQQAISSVAFGPDGQALVAGSHDGLVWRWRLVGGLGGDPRRRWRSRPATAAPCGTSLSVRTVCTWPSRQSQRPGGAVEQPARRPLPDGLAGHPAEVYALAFNPRHPLLAYGNGGTIEVFDQARGAFVSPGPEPLSGGVRQLAFSPDGRALAAVGSGTDNRVALWDVEREESAGELRAPDDARLWRIALSPDGRTLAAGGCEKTEDDACTQGAIHLWDLARKERLGQALVGHTDWVTGLAFSADSRLLASGSDDRTVRLWDVADPARARSGAHRSPTTGGGGHPQPGLQPGRADAGLRRPQRDHHPVGRQWSPAS